MDFLGVRSTAGSERILAKDIGSVRAGFYSHNELVLMRGQVNSNELGTVNRDREGINELFL